MLFRLALLSVAAILPMAGCDLLTGAKGKDGEAMGYACRVSNKLPEDCMKENSTYTPTSILAGWKMADKDIKDRKADMSSGKGQPPVDGMAEGAPKAAAGGKSEGTAPPAEAKMDAAPAPAAPPQEPEKH